MSDKIEKDPKEQDAVTEDVITVEDVEIVEEIAEETPPAPAVKAKTGFTGLLLVAILGGVATIALTFGAGYVAIKTNNLGVISSLLNDSNPSTEADNQFAELAVRILSLENEIAGLQDVVPTSVQDANPLPVVDLTPLSDKITALEALIALQDDKIANFRPSTGVNTVIDNSEIESLKAQISVINDEIEAVKKIANNNNKTVGSEAAKNMASALAVASLERALQDEAPFEAELNTVKSFATDTAAVTSLNAYASQGLPSELSLMAQFDDLLEKALVADLKGEGASVLDKFIGNAKSVISIRRTGDITGDDAEAVLARMEVAIKAKDLAKATTIGADLTGPAQKTFADWMAKSNSRLAAKQLMKQISSDILQSLSQ